MKVSSARINTLLFIVVGVLLSVFINSIDTYALTYSSNVNVQFTFNPTLSVSLSSNDLVISNLAPGTASDSNIITVNVKTNNITGYTINATVGNNTTFDTRDLKHQNSNVVNKFTSVNFGTIVATNTALTDNTWGYSYSLDNGSTWIANTTSSTSAGYSGLPLYSDGTNIATLKESTAPTATSSGDDIKFKIAARASNEQSSGEYNNVINFTTVANPEPQLEPISCSGANKICYSANSLGLVEGTMGEQSANANSSVTLLASNFSREGYGFAGWSDAYDYAANQNAHFYGPQEDITTPSDMSSGLALYAIWIPSAGSMQTDAASVCSGLTTAATDGTANLASVSALTDRRDNQTYAIAKLADGKCWMIENLRLEADNTRTAEKQALAQGYGTSTTYGNFSGLADAEAPWANNSTTANSLYSTDGSNDTVNIGTGGNPGYRFPRYNNLNTPADASNRPQNPTSNTFADNSTTVGMYSYGNYYTWAAAIADTAPYTTNNVSVTNTSLCPSGWHLPKGGGAYASDGTTGVNITGNTSTYREFYNLGYKIMNEVKTAYEDTPNGYASYYSSATTNTVGDTATKAFRRYPNNFVYSGYVSGRSVNGRGSSGDYWSSTTYSAANAYNLRMNSSLVNPGTNITTKYDGWTIRCVASGA